MMRWCRCTQATVTRVEVISHCVWLYYRLSSLTVRGRVTDGRVWGRGDVRDDPHLVSEIQSRVRPPTAAEHSDLAIRGISDEVFIKVAASANNVWRAVEQHGNVLDILIRGKRDGSAATRFFRTLLKHQRYPSNISVTRRVC